MKTNRNYITLDDIIVLINRDKLFELFREEPSSMKANMEINELIEIKKLPGLDSERLTWERTNQHRIEKILDHLVNLINRHSKSDIPIAVSYDSNKHRRDYILEHIITLVDIKTLYEFVIEILVRDEDVIVDKNSMKYSGSDDEDAKKLNNLLNRNCINLVTTENSNDPMKVETIAQQNNQKFKVHLRNDVSMPSSEPSYRWETGTGSTKRQAICIAFLRLVLKDE